jgi:uncharacterized protein YgfB (UPF0149 family)
MHSEVDYDTLDDALRRCGASWDAAQSHGALTGRMAVAGENALPEVVAQILDGTDPHNALRAECEGLLVSLFASTHQALVARQSEFTLLLPDKSGSTTQRAEAIAHYSEGFLHGLVSGQTDEKVKAQLAEEPIADIIKDMLEITRATADEGDGDESSEQAYTDIVEYLRVATQLVYEELDAQRSTAPQ